MRRRRGGSTRGGARTPVASSEGVGVRLLAATTIRAYHVAGLVPFARACVRQETRPHCRAAPRSPASRRLRQFLVEGAAVAPDETDLEVVLPQCCSRQVRRLAGQENRYAVDSVVFAIRQHPIVHRLSDGTQNH